MEGDYVGKSEEILDKDNYASQNESFFDVLLFLFLAESMNLLLKRRQRHLLFESFFERTLQICKIPLLILFDKN
jgi:hypothetical protein